MSSISSNSLSTAYLQSILGTAAQKAPSATAKSAASQSDSGSLSPVAQLLGSLQQLQQSDPAKYQQVTGQIAARLQTAAQTAQANGNTTAASQLTQLASDFTQASKSGQLPNLQDLAQAVGGHHHHHGHSHAASADSDSTASAQTQTSTDPLSIISNALSNSGSTSATPGTTES